MLEHPHQLTQKCHFGQEKVFYLDEATTCFGVEQRSQAGECPAIAPFLSMLLPCLTHTPSQLPPQP